MDLIKEHEVFQKLGGLFENKKGFLKVSGPDRVDFLHRITSQDIKNLSSGVGTGACLLSAAGTILSFFRLYNCGQFFLLVIDDEQFQACFDNLEKLYFAEDLEMKDVSDEFKFLSVQGRGVGPALKTALGRIPAREREIVGLEECFITWKSDFHKDTQGFHLFIKAESYDEVLKDLETQHLGELSIQLWNLLRAESGHFTMNVDVDEKNLVVEAPLDAFVARDKGCYPGQEVVERIFTYGNISKKLMGIKISSEDALPDGLAADGSKIRQKLVHESDDAGYVTSLVRIPWTDQVTGFGVIRKPFYEKGQKLKLQIDGVDIGVEVFPLPSSFDIKKNS